MNIPYFQVGAVIDLTTKTAAVETLEKRLYEDFLGGKGIGAILLYHHLAPRTDPLSPLNILVFLTGPLTGSQFPASSRATMVTKSPLTGTFLDCNIGGSFGKALKSTGFDYLIIKGKADVPTWIDIHDRKIEFKSASELWGLTTSETDKAIKRKIDDKTIDVLAIGPAGEKGVLFASIACGTRMFGRGGAGAVMGSKNLKAIAIKGSAELPWFQSKSFIKEAKQANEKLRLNASTKKGGPFPTLGTSFTVNVMQNMGVLPTRNWQDSIFDGAEKIFSNAFLQRKTGSTGCYRCPIGCGAIVKTTDKEPNRVARRPEYETIYAFGSNCGISDPDTIIEANNLCEDFGMDTITCGLTISFIMECSEKKIFNGRSGGVYLRFGDSEGLLETIKLIGNQEGYGKSLGKGTKRLAEKIGKETDRFAICVKGLELPGYDPRGMKGMALLYATSDRGGCHVRGSTLRAELLGMPVPVDRFAYEGKARLVAELQKNYALMNVYSECLFAGFALTIDDYSAALSALFEKSVTSTDLLSIGKRIWDVTRLFNCREGFSPEDDTLPKRLFEDPVPSGPSKGQVVDKGSFESMKKEYYKLQAWDASTGIPSFDISNYSMGK